MILASHLAPGIPQQAPPSQRWGSRWSPSLPGSCGSSRDLNSGTHACMARALSPEPSPQPQCCVGCSRTSHSHLTSKQKLDRDAANVPHLSQVSSLLRPHHRNNGEPTPSLDSWRHSSPPVSTSLCNPCLPPASPSLGSH